MAPVLMLLLAAVLNGAMVLRTAVCAANSARGTAIRQPQRDGIAGYRRNAGRGLEFRPRPHHHDRGRQDVQVNTQATAHTVFDYSGLSFTNLVASKAVMRVQ